MEKYLLIIAITLMIDWGGGILLNYNKKKQLKRDDDLFIFKLEQILINKNLSPEKRKQNAKELCRNTKGKLASGAYLVLDNIEN